MSALPLRLNLVEGSVSFNFSLQAARELQAALNQLMERLKAVANQTAGAPGKANPQKNLEYQYTGDIFLEIFCNPNIWPSPFAAKVLLTVRDDRIRFTSEAELTRLVDDVSQYIEQVG